MVVKCDKDNKFEHPFFICWEDCYVDENDEIGNLNAGFIFVGFGCIMPIGVALRVIILYFFYEMSDHDWNREGFLIVLAGIMAIILVGCIVNMLWRIQSPVMTTNMFIDHYVHVLQTVNEDDETAKVMLYDEFMTKHSCVPGTHRKGYEYLRNDFKNILLNFKID